MSSKDKVASIIQERRARQKEEAQGDNRFYSTVARDGGTIRALDLRFKSGMRVAFPYTQLSFCNYDHTEGVIDVEFNGHLVTIQGHGLDPVLYEAIIDGKVSWVREADSDWEDNESVETFITSIVITPPESHA